MKYSTRHREYLNNYINSVIYGMKLGNNTLPITPLSEYWKHLAETAHNDKRYSFKFMCYLLRLREQAQRRELSLL